MNVGYVLERKNIEKNGNFYNVCMVKDFVAGFNFVNIEKQDVLHIVSDGKYNGRTFTLLRTAGENDNVFVVLKDIGECVSINGNSYEFAKMRDAMLKVMKLKYFALSGNNEFTTIVDEDLLLLVEKEFSNRSSSYSDEVEIDSNISQMYASIKNTIIAQDEQIMMMLTSLFKNQLVVNSDFDGDLMAKLKENILVFGPTGTGKTEILKCISRLYGIPIVIQDATLLSETGYAGRNVVDMLEDLYKATGDDKEAAEKGILVIDEFDKLAEKLTNANTHVSRIGVQRGLLKLLDGSEFFLKNGECFDTSRLTIVALGAFSGITSEISSETRRVGFEVQNTETSASYGNIGIEDFVKYGLARELIGRFSKLIAMNSLTEIDIARILVESNYSPLNTYKKLFNLLGVKFDYNDEFVGWIASKAASMNSGARSLKTVVDGCLSDIMFKIFEGKYSEVLLSKPDNDEEKPYVLKKVENLSI